MKYIIDIPNEMVIKSPSNGLTLGIAMIETSTQKQFIIPTNIPLISCIEPQKWIPVSERLPKKDGRYQVTRYDYVTNTEFIEILWYEENIWWNRRSMRDYAVTAWMPLPEPYKGEEE